MLLDKFRIASGLISPKNEPMNAALSNEDCVKLNPLVALKVAVGPALEVAPAVKKPGRLPGTVPTMVAPNVALPVMLPVPTIVGISRKETGMLSEERTMLSNILSFPYSSITSR